MHTFEVTVQRQAGDVWPVVVEHSTAGVFLPVRDEGVCALDLVHLRSQPTPRDYGTALGQALFREEVRDAFVAASVSSAEPLRVLLFIEATDLKTLRWERLCAPFDGHWDFLALDQRVTFSLYLPSLTDRRFPPIGRRDLRALVLAASPAGLEAYNLAPFDVSTAVSSIHTALGDIPCEVLANTPGASGPPTLDALCAHITAQSYTILHIVCHGQFRRSDGETLLYLAREEQHVEVVESGRILERLGRLQGVRGLPHLTFLSTCESARPEAEGAMGGLAQRLVRELGMPAVIAMTERVSVSTAQALAEGFYRRLRTHGEVDRGLAEACAGLAEHYDITVPALYSRLGGRPLFSDTLDRPLTTPEILFGLTRLETLIPERAPALQGTATGLIARLRSLSGAAPSSLSTNAHQEQTADLAAANTLCGEALDLSFNALALGQDPPAYDARCPFRGLYPFRDAEREFFFGREALIAQLQQRVIDDPFLAVLGPSGSGKSSLVLAGLMPALQAKEPGLQLAYMTPGPDPLAALEASLAPASGHRQVLVLDQGEELFTLCTDGARRQAFLERFLALARTQPVVLTMRADFWGECAAYPALKDLMLAHQELIGPMQTAELRRAIELQAAQVGLRFEADLSHAILDDAQGEPGAMPLLQHALLELWRRRHGRWLRAEEYRTLGGVQQAIARTADEVYTQLAPPERDRMRDIFLRLTRLEVDAVQGEGRRDTRQRVNLAELVPAGDDPSATKALVAQLADARLVVTSVHAATGREEVEVAHEALIRYWPRLGTWLDEDRSGLRLREGLRAAALDWHAGQRDDSLLIHRGSRLQEAIALAGRPRFTLNAQEQAYIDACMALREREQAAAEAQRQRELEAARQLAEEQRQRAEVQTRAARRLRNLAGVLTVVFLAAIGVAMLAWSEQRRAQHNADLAQLRTNEAIAAHEKARAERDRATAQVRITTSGHLAARALNRLRDGQFDLSLLLGLEAHRIHDTPDARLNLLGALHQYPRLMTFLRGHTSGVASVAYSPTGTTALSGSWDGTLRLWDMHTLQALGSPFLGHQETVTSVAFSPDGHLAVSGSGDMSLLLWDVATGKPLSPPLQGHRSQVTSVAFSPDGRLLASGSSDRTLRLWDVATRQPLDPPLTGHTDEVTSVAFSPTGETIISGSWDGTLRFWDVESRQARGTSIVSRVGRVEAVAFSPDGLLVAVGGEGNISLWEATTQQPLEPLLSGHTDGVRALAFSPDSRLLASGSSLLDKTIALWDVARRQPVGPPLVSHSKAVNSVVFSPEGRYLVSASGDGRLIAWDLMASHRLGDPLPRSPGRIHSVAVHPDGRLLAAGSCTQTDQAHICRAGVIQLWDLSTAQPYGPLLTGHVGDVQSLVFTADRTRLLSGSCAQVQGATCVGLEVRQWDVTTGQPLGSLLTGSMPHLKSIAISANGTIAAAGGCATTTGVCQQGAIYLWNVSLGQPLGPPLLGHAYEVGSLALSPDGTLLASSSGAEAILWDVSRQRLLHHLTPGDRVAFSQDGRLVATTGNGLIILHDVETGRPSGSPMAGIPEMVWTLTFSHDNRFLAASGANLSYGDLGTIALWDVEARLRLGAPFTGHTDWVRSLVFSPDGAWLFSGSEDASLLRWEISPEAWKRRACRIANRNLTRLEWQQYLRQEPYRATCSDLPVEPPLRPGELAAGRANVGDGAVTFFERVLALERLSGWEAHGKGDLLRVSGLIAKGWFLASAGDIEGATGLFRQAIARSNGLELAPEIDAQRLAAPYHVQLGQRLAMQGHIQAALASYARAQELHPSLHIAAAAWHTLCWAGSLWGHAATVTAACEQAVTMEPDHPVWHMSRGLARSLTGDPRGALEDFKFCQTQKNLAACEPVMTWLDALQRGTNPFTPEALARLR